MGIAATRACLFQETNLMQLPVLLCLLVLLSFSSHSGYAQGGYLPGYIVTRINDTLPGSVKDRTSGAFARVHKKIRFKGKSLFVKKYSAAQIKGYQRGETFFESHWLQVESRLFKLEYHSIAHRGRQQFLKLKERGFLSYYQLEQWDYETSGIDEIDLFKRNGENYFIRVTQGIAGLRRNALEGYFKDCPELVQKIGSRQLRTPLEIVRLYNTACSN